MVRQTQRTEFVDRSVVVADRLVRIPPIAHPGEGGQERIAVLHDVGAVVIGPVVHARRPLLGYEHMVAVQMPDHIVGARRLTVPIAVRTEEQYGFGLPGPRVAQGLEIRTFDEAQVTVLQTEVGQRAIVEHGGADVMEPYAVGALIRADPVALRQIHDQRLRPRVVGDVWVPGVGLGVGRAHHRGVAIRQEGPPLVARVGDELPLHAVDVTGEIRDQGGAGQIGEESALVGDDRPGRHPLPHAVELRYRYADIRIVHEIPRLDVVPLRAVAVVPVPGVAQVKEVIIPIAALPDGLYVVHEPLRGLVMVGLVELARGHAAHCRRCGSRVAGTRGDGPSRPTGTDDECRGCNGGHHEGEPPHAVSPRPRHGRLGSCRPRQGRRRCRPTHPHCRSSHIVAHVHPRNLIVTATASYTAHDKESTG